GHGTGVADGGGQRAGLLDEVDGALPTVIGYPRQETSQVQGLCERPVVTDSTHDRHGLDAEVDLTGGGVTASHLNGGGGQQRAGSRRRAFGRRGYSRGPPPAGLGGRPAGPPGKAPGGRRA